MSKGASKANYKRWPRGYQAKTKSIQVRMTHREKRAIAFMAAAKGHRSVSAYIRALIDLDRAAS